MTIIYFVLVGFNIKFPLFILSLQNLIGNFLTAEMHNTSDVFPDKCVFPFFLYSADYDKYSEDPEFKPASRHTKDLFEEVSVGSFIFPILS